MAATMTTTVARMQPKPMSGAKVGHRQAVALSHRQAVAHFNSYTGSVEHPFTFVRPDCPPVDFLTESSWGTPEQPKNKDCQGYSYVVKPVFRSALEQVSWATNQIFLRELEEEEAHRNQRHGLRALLGL